jgi:hypothetical protein
VAFDFQQHDSDPDGNLAAATIRIDSGPTHGTIVTNNAFELVYTSETGFSGVDSFSYTVADTDGARSKATTVEIEVLGNPPWQNSIEPLDVNNDGAIVPLDALVVIRELNINGPHSFANQARLADSPYYDVSGDDFLSSLDALRIIRHLNQPVAVGEPPEVLSPATPNDAVFAFLAAAMDDESNEYLKYRPGYRL